MSLQPRKKSLGKRGFSFVELVIGMVVLVVGLVPMVSMMIRVVNGIENHENKIRSILVAKDLMETIKKKRWDEKSDEPPTYIDEGSTLGADSGETDPADFDDVDDFDGYNDTINSDFSRSVEVGYVTFIGGKVNCTTSKTDYKQITITVDPLSKVGTKQTISMIMSNAY